MSDFYIRAADIDDLPVLKIILKTASSDWTSTILKNCFSEHYKQWVICFDSQILGLVVIRNNISSYEIMQIAIKKLYQRQGLAKRLLQFVIHDAQKNNVKKLQLEVRSSNEAAMTLYLKSGFKQVGVRKKYYANGEDAVLMDCMIELERRKNIMRMGKRRR